MPCPGQFPPFNMDRQQRGPFPNPFDAVSPSCKYLAVRRKMSFKEPTRQSLSRRATRFSTGGQPHLLGQVLACGLISVRVVVKACSGMHMEGLVGGFGGVGNGVHLARLEVEDVKKMGRDIEVEDGCKMGQGTKADPLTHATCGLQKRIDGVWLAVLNVEARFL